MRSALSSGVAWSPFPFVRVAVGLALLGLSACNRAPEAQTTPAARAAAPAAVPLRLSGSVEAVRSRSVTVPRLRGTFTPMVITYLVPAGTRVNEGDVLVEFDPQEQRRLALDKRAELVDLEGQIAKKKTEQSAAEAKDTTELKQAEHDVERARLDVKKNPLVAKVEAEKNTLALEQQTARYEQLRTTFKLKREAAAADLRILEIRRDRSQSAMAYAEKNAELMQIRAPFSGLVVIKSQYKGGSGLVPIVEGDEVRPGAAVIDIVDTSEMQVRARVNQADGDLVRAGLEAEIRLDGFPELKFPGRVEQVTPLATPSEMSRTVRSFTAVISIQGTHEQLLPDLTASVEIRPGQPAAAAQR